MVGKKTQNLWCSDDWKMHMQVQKEIEFGHFTHVPRQNYHPVSYHEPQTEGNYSSHQAAFLLKSVAAAERGQ